MKEKTLLGLVGHPGSGKDTAAEYLVKKYNFTHVSLSDLIREYIKENDLGGLDRENMRQVGIAIREKYGAGYLTSLALKKSSDRIIITAVRTLAEAGGIKENGGKIIALQAPIEFRFKLSQERGRAGDGAFEEFKAIEEKEYRGTDPNTQNVQGVMDIADFTVNNDGTMESLYKQIDNLIAKILF